MTLTMIVTWSILFLAPSSGWAQSIVAAVLPSSRSVQLGIPATAFATIINAGSVTATSCGISLVTAIPATFSFQTTNPLTNQVTGSPNTPLDIPPGAAQSFVFAMTPTAPIASTDVQFSFDCADTDPVPINVGLNTFLLSASATPVPDIVALAVTLSNDGIVNVPGTNGAGAFAVATVNLGVMGTITSSADTGSATLPVNVSLCQTDPATGQCISAIGPTVTTAINANATPTFGIFIQGNGNVPFDPAVNRIFVRFKDSGGVTRGSTSVAVRTGTPRFTLTDLGAFVPAEINNKGQIVGFSFSLHAVLYEDDKLYDLSTLGGFYSEAYSLNNRGQVVGFSWTTRGCFCHAFLWEDGAMTDLTPLSEYPTLANGKGTSAYDINDRGQIVGAVHIDGVVSGPVLWDNGEIIPLGTLGGTLGEAYRINNSGQIAGWSYLAGDTSYHAFLYTDGTMMDLGTFGGTASEAKSINDRGQVVGYATTAEDETHAFLFTQGTMIDLSLLATATGSSYAPDINNRGQVIVQYTLGHSFLYDNGTMTDLTELVYTKFGWIGFSAAGINDAGWIVGSAANNNGDFVHAVLLSPVP